ncbi:CEI_1a_G0006450.mRNA.1.CDS.1 [Saccharomyces cerevisiae]|nr:EM14S01-3B_G0040830.mRNA.1.CDS.1 [Saccharomyces cerevisiae]CAI4305602.1 AMH_1a_G0006500.mRNA.1.CDS.1 [Saccharomyces cerevisiae]CAI4311690.1 CEI_1a_G0006450.mRNA.1.CDS.1 [Saccharomyces cerevisiae]CAI6526104.1 AMH_1a_G0006500.mRNA.1.CDS.1 [Saccharomyces cerevisiae]CAI7174025.1 CEI_1a_G0006450.mRNA.1.CDS.1 [Saccharomyces cerevisiae]
MIQNSAGYRSLNTASPMAVQVKNQKKICARCNKLVVPDSQRTKTTLKALGKYYHESCFTCQDCQKPLKPKYFPYQVNKTSEPILLCQYDYFRRHNLLCHVCDTPLRGLYYTAFGYRYDEEHFSCTICATPCGVKKCFMYENQLYCKYHFLKYFSKRCKGCKFPISDQYIEFPKGEEIHCWHPECYGIHKYWHVNLAAETVGLQYLPKLEYNPNSGDKDINPTAYELDKQMQAFNFILSKTWSVLYRFEEEAASCISDMFQYLTSNDQLKGIESTGLLVLKIDCLFRGLDTLNLSTNKSMPVNSDQECIENNAMAASKYSKFPKNLSTKIMIYLQLLRKLGTENKNETITISSFMSVITGLAHFLKLLTRFGLYTALENNKLTHSVNPLLRFLREVEKNELFENNPFQYIKTPVNATDSCAGCNKYIQEECIQFYEHRWHIACFTCSSCHKNINPRSLTDPTFNKEKKKILCSHCSIDDPASVPGFKFVTKLAQLIFLLKIALVKSRTVMLKSKASNKVGRNSLQSTMLKEQTYIRTLNDIKRLRSRRESVRVTHNKQQARKSVILETAETDLNDPTKQGDSKNLVIQTDDPSSSQQVSTRENVFSNTKTLTLDDISRIVAAEQARELRPNAFAHFKKLKETDDETSNVVPKKSGVYYSELSTMELSMIRAISLSLLAGKELISKTDPNYTNLVSMVFSNEKQVTGSFWNRMKIMMSMEPKKTITKTVFGAPLDVLCEKWGVDSDLGVGPVKIRIPIIIDELISSLRQMDMSVEGIFRKNGNIRRLRELTANIDSNPTEAPDFSKENAIQLSALLKKFIRELPQPILSTDLYELWIKAAKIDLEDEKQRVILLIYSLLPTYNRNLLEALLSFLHWTSSFSYIENEMGSKMDIHNLSTVITPNILYLRHKEISNDNVPDEPESGLVDSFAQNKGENYFLAIEIVDYLITHNEEMAMVPKFLMNLLKDVQLQKLDNYESINHFISTVMQSKTIDYSECDIKTPVTVKDSTTTVIQGEINK